MEYQCEDGGLARWLSVKFKAKREFSSQWQPFSEGLKVGEGRSSNNMNLKANPTTEGRVDGGSIKLVTLKDGGVATCWWHEGLKGAKEGWERKSKFE
ncbi:hypothetical protein ACSQ67_026356 [Phaseolus vulgaris]